jgi:hypothetical protein
MRERDKDNIRHCIDQIFRAYIEQDTNLLDEICIPKWQGFGLNTKTIAKSSISYVNGVRDLLSQHQFLEYEMVDIEYTFWGDVCVVPYVVRVRILSAGAEEELMLNVLDVYCQQENDWHQISAHIHWELE